MEDSGNEELDDINQNYFIEKDETFVHDEEEEKLTKTQSKTSKEVDGILKKGKGIIHKINISAIN